MTIQVLSNEKPQEQKPEADKPAEGALPEKPAEGTESAPGGESQPEQNESEVSESSETEVEGEGQSEGNEGSEESSESKDAAESESKPKKKSGFQRKINKLNARIADKEREAAYWREQALKSASSAGQTEPKVEPAKAAAAEGEPQPEQFDDHKSYVKALAKWEAKQILDEDRRSRETTQLQTEQQKQVEAYTERAKAFAAKVPDYDDVMAEVGDYPLSPAIRDVLLSSENGPELAYHLAKDPEEFVRMCKLPPGQAYREMGKFEAKLSLKSSSGTQEQKTKTITKAPKPLNPVNAGGKGSVQKSIYEAHALSQADYERVRREQMKQRSRA